MLDKDKKKGLVIAIMGKMGKKPKPEGEDMEGDAMHSDEEDASEPNEKEAMASEILDAIKSRDAKGLAEALESFVSCCSGEEEE